MTPIRPIRSLPTPSLRSRKPRAHGSTTPTRSPPSQAPPGAPEPGGTSRRRRPRCHGSRPGDPGATGRRWSSSPGPPSPIPVSPRSRARLPFPGSPRSRPPTNPGCRDRTGDGPGSPSPTPTRGGHASAPARPSQRRPEPEEDPAPDDWIQFGSDQAGRGRRPGPARNQYPASGLPGQAWPAWSGQVPLSAPVMVGASASGAVGSAGFPGAALPPRAGGAPS